MGRVKRSVITGIAAAGLVVGSAVAANAINRVSCDNYDYLWVMSSSTTCWANAGTQNVALFSVQGISSGNNAGYLMRSTGEYNYFSSHTQATYSPYVVTINQVHIN